MLSTIVIATLVLLGSTLQVVTGVGLGLIAAPALLFFIDSVSAIQVAIVLNLLLTFCLLFAERAQFSKQWLVSLSAWAMLGIPCGFGLVLLLSSAVLKIFAATLLLAALLQLKFFPTLHSQSGSSEWPKRVGGYFSGVLTGALAAPGPAALWVLLSHGVDVVTARATLRYYFVVAYGFAFALHIGVAGVGDRLVETLLFLVPALVIGLFCGFVVRGKVSQSVLRRVLESVLLLMAVSLLIKGVVDLAMNLTWLI